MDYKERICLKRTKNRTGIGQYFEIKPSGFHQQPDFPAITNYKPQTKPRMNLK